MIEVIFVAIYIWLLLKVSKLLFKIAWSATKAIAGFLFLCSLPVLLMGVLLASGVVLLIPIGLLVLAVCVLCGSA